MAQIGSVVPADGKIVSREIFTYQSMLWLQYVQERLEAKDGIHQVHRRDPKTMTLENAKEILKTIHRITIFPDPYENNPRGLQHPLYDFEALAQFNLKNLQELWETKCSLMFEAIRHRELEDGEPLQGFKLFLYLQTYLLTPLVTYATGYSFFIPLLFQVEHCNCVCGTLMIAAALEALGLITPEPSSFGVVMSHGHIHLYYQNPDGQKLYFETTNPDRNKDQRLAGKPVIDMLYSWKDEINQLHLIILAMFISTDKKKVLTAVPSPCYQTFLNDYRAKLSTAQIIAVLLLNGARMNDSPDTVETWSRFYENAKDEYTTRNASTSVNLPFYKLLNVPVADVVRLQTAIRNYLKQAQVLPLTELNPRAKEIPLRISKLSRHFEVLLAGHRRYLFDFVELLKSPEKFLEATKTKEQQEDVFRFLNMDPVVVWWSTIDAHTLLGLSGNDSKEVDDEFDFIAKVKPRLRAPDQLEKHFLLEATRLLADLHTMLESYGFIAAKLHLQLPHNIFLQYVWRLKSIENAFPQFRSLLELGNAHRNDPGVQPHQRVPFVFTNEFIYEESKQKLQDVVLTNTPLAASLASDHQWIARQHLRQFQINSLKRKQEREERKASQKLRKKTSVSGTQGGTQRGSQSGPQSGIHEDDDDNLTLVDELDLEDLDRQPPKPMDIES